MANVIKYSTSKVDNTIKKGNIVLGINNIGYGPTESTGFWNGIDPPTNGYTIYSFPGSGTTPNAVTASNDNDLIYQAKNFGGTNISTATNALQFFASGSPINIAINKTYLNVVTSGLTYLYDGGFVPSYPTAGTSWYDLSGNGYVGTLVNGPTYSAGTINFDGIDDYMSIPDGITLSGATTMLFTINGNYQNYYLSVFERSSATGAGLSTGIPQNGWVQVGFIWNGSTSSFVLNGTTYSANVGGGFPYDNALYRPLFWAGNFSYFGSNSSPNLSFHLQNNSGGSTGFSWSGFTYKAINVTATAGNRRYFSGNTANVLIYNRALTSNEVIQNYEATMNQYGSLQVQFLVVAGGGSGGYTGYPSGGGGAGGLLTGSTTALTINTNYTITVGAGGSASNGSNSVFNSSTSIGGGRGGNGRSGVGVSGGSGGGGASNYPGDVAPTYLTAAGSGTAGQGNSGGVGKSVYGDTSLSGIPTGAGGGGGAGGAGGVGTTTPVKKAGDGGVGLYFSEYTSIGGSPVGWFAGGGGGSTSFSNSASNGVGIGGNGGGGNGSYTQFSAGPTATAGAANTGGGGGGAGYEEYTYKSGGSGIVILRIPDVFTANFSSGVSSTMTRSGGYKYYKVTATSTTSETVYFS